MIEIERMKKIINENKNNKSLDEWIKEIKLNPFLSMSKKEVLLEWLSLKSAPCNALVEQGELGSEDVG